MFAAGAMGKPAAQKRAFPASGPRVVPIAAANVAAPAAGHAAAAEQRRVFVRGRPSMFDNYVCRWFLQLFFGHFNSATLPDLTSISPSAAVLGSQAGERT